MTGRGLACGLALGVATMAAGEAVATAVGEPAPACTARRLEVGDTLNPRDFSGKVVYLDFWASWCGPCRVSMPFMNDLQREFEGRGLQVVGINVDEQPEDAQAFLRKLPVNFQVALDPEGHCPAAFGVPGMPTSYLIGRDGVVRYIHLGFRRGDQKELRERVEQLLAGD